MCMCMDTTYMHAHSQLFKLNHLIPFVWLLPANIQDAIEHYYFSICLRSKVKHSPEINKIYQLKILERTHVITKYLPILK